MTTRARQLFSVVGTFSALALAACGSEDEPKGTPLPAASVAQLQQRLDEVERRFQDAVDNANIGACDDIGNDSLPAIQDVIAGLPAKVDPELRTAVEQSFARLAELTETECADIEPEPAPEETVPEETIPEETVPQETIPEETVPEETVPQETIPEEIVPPGNGNGNGNGGGNGNGNGNGGGIEVPPGLEEDG